MQTKAGADAAPDIQTRAAQRFTSLAGSPNADELVNELLAAAQDQVLETIAGSGAVPSSMAAVRAELLYHACLRAQRILGQKEVQILFRTLPANAKLIIATMRATYEDALRTASLRRMIDGAKVAPSGDDRTGRKWKIAFPDDSTFETAVDEIQRLGFTTSATADDRKRVIEVPRVLEDHREPLRLLQLTEPGGKPTKRR